MKTSYKLTFTMQTDDELPQAALDDLVGALYAQFEGLTDDHGYQYSGPEFKLKIFKASENLTDKGSK